MISSIWLSKKQNYGPKEEFVVYESKHWRESVAKKGNTR